MAKYKSSSRISRRRKAGGPCLAPREEGGEGIWLYGRHAVLAALDNPKRVCSELVVAEQNLKELAERLPEAAVASGKQRPEPQVIDRRDLESLLPPGATHQGIALRVQPLPAAFLDTVWQDLTEGAPDTAPATVIVLDQASDPRNVGAVLRSAAAFGVRAVVIQSRHSPAESATMAKAASGALETVPLVRKSNIVQAMDALKGNGFWCVGLTATAQSTIGEVDLGGRTVLALGSEGGGLRRLVREACDLEARIPIRPGMESLNLSNAAAVALYEAARRRDSGD